MAQEKLFYYESPEKTNPHGLIKPLLLQMYEKKILAPNLISMQGSKMTYLIIK